MKTLRDFWLFFSSRTHATKNWPCSRATIRTDEEKKCERKTHLAHEGCDTVHVPLMREYLFYEKSQIVNVNQGLNAFHCRRFFPCIFGLRDPPRKIEMRPPYGASPSFRWVLVSVYSGIVRCFRVWHLACTEYWIKVFTPRKFRTGVKRGLQNSLPTNRAKLLDFYFPLLSKLK